MSNEWDPNIACVERYAQQLTHYSALIARLPYPSLMTHYLSSFVTHYSSPVTRNKEVFYVDG